VGEFYLVTHGVHCAVKLKHFINSWSLFAALVWESVLQIQNKVQVFTVKQDGSRRGHHLWRDLIKVISIIN
jgi:hypothetical protein